MLAVPGPPAHEVPIEQARAGHEAETEALVGPGDEVAEVVDVDAAGVPTRLYRPQAARGAVAYLHGGGWAVGSIESFDAVCRALANAAGATVACPAYRLAPEHPFPAGLEDCVAVVRWLAEHEQPLAIAGDSAGGNLATVVARRLRGQVPLRHQALVYPVCDAGLNTPSYREFGEDRGLTAAGMQRYWNLYLDGGDGLSPDASPLRADLDDLAGLPPATILTAEEDVLRDEGEAYAAALERAGVPVTLRRIPGTIHGFLRWLAASRLARETVEEVGAALRAGLDGDPPPAWTNSAARRE